MIRYLLLIALIYYAAYCQGQEKKSLDFQYTDSVSANIKAAVTLKSSNLPIVLINAGTRALNTGATVRGHMGIINNEGERNYATDRWNDYDRKISIRITGKDAFRFDKKSYLIETQRDNGDNFDASIMGMPKENDWILYAPYSDKTLIRNALMHHMAKQAGYYSSRIAFCELKLNNRYQGVYMLMEVVKQDANRVDIEDLSNTDTVGTKLTGGYIVKIDELPGEFNFGEHGWRSDGDFPDVMDITYQYVYPNSEKINNTQKQYLKNYLSEFEAVLYSENFNDPNTGYHNYIDVGSFVDYMLLNEVSKAVTAYNEGVYFYKANISNGGKLFAGPISDYTFGFNNADYWSTGKRANGFVYTDKWRLMYWWYRLMQDKYFYNLAYTRWLQLREQKFSDENLFSYIDSITNVIEEARIRNFEKWEILGNYVYPNAYVANDYNEEIKELKKWLSERMLWMDKEFFGTILQPEVTISNYKFTESRAAIKVKLSDEYFNKSVLDNNFFKIQGLPSNVYIDTVIYETSSEAIIVLSKNATPDYVTNALELTIQPNVLNGFNPVVSNNLILDIYSREQGAKPNIYFTNNQLVINSENPDVLPDFMEVYSITGQKIISLKLNKQKQNNIPIELEPNVYIVKLKLNNSLVAKRIAVL